MEENIELYRSDGDRLNPNGPWTPSEAEARSFGDEFGHKFLYKISVPRKYYEDHFVPSGYGMKPDVDLELALSDEDVEREPI